jgi:hypothetical protein
MKFSILFVCLTLAQSCFSMHDEFYCFASDPVKPQRSMFATQSDYEATRGARIDPNVSGELHIECRVLVQQVAV